MLQWAQAYFTGKFFPLYKEFVTTAPGPIEFESVQFPSITGKTLHGLFIPGRPPIHGTVVHCHGNAGTIKDHAPMVTFLSEAGFHVLVFDYGGYGKSEGHPTPLTIIDDTRAAL